MGLCVFRRELSAAPRDEHVRNGETKESVRERFAGVVEGRRKERAGGGRGARKNAVSFIVLPLVLVLVLDIFVFVGLGGAIDIGQE